MNRRSFLRNLAVAAAGFAILPSATTYARKWKFTTPATIAKLNPEWVTAEYQFCFDATPATCGSGILVGRWKYQTDPHPIQIKIEHTRPLIFEPPHARMKMQPNGTYKVVYPYTENAIDTTTLLA